jgi:putative ABC transport system permease protein
LTTSGSSSFLETSSAFVDPDFFSIVAIIISCLGLFGLATYSAQIRTKEIGIRRVLGATVIQVTSLLARDFITLIAFSFFIAAPVAGWLMSAFAPR